MIEEQWPAARALVGWSQGDLAEKIGASVLTIKRLETGSRNVSDVMRQRAKEALEGAGVIFVEENGEGPGVRLRRRSPHKMTAEDFEGYWQRMLDALFSNGPQNPLLRLSELKPVRVKDGLHLVDESGEILGTALLKGDKVVLEPPLTSALTSPHGLISEADIINWIHRVWVKKREKDAYKKGLKR
jgi:hypothetical protein